jgi:hypothetical protein
MKMKNENEMNLYILNCVLSDYTDGMAVVSAPSLERCWELFKAEFGQDDDREFAKIKVIENVPQPEGVVSYVYGGG